MSFAGHAGAEMDLYGKRRRLGISKGRRRMRNAGGWSCKIRGFVSARTGGTAGGKIGGCGFASAGMLGSISNKPNKFRLGVPVRRCQVLPGAAGCCRVRSMELSILGNATTAVAQAPGGGLEQQPACGRSGRAGRMTSHHTQHAARSMAPACPLPTCPVSELPAVRNLNDCAAVSLLDSSSLVPPPPPSHSIPLHPPSSAVGGGHQQPRRPQHPGTPACDPCSQHAVRSGIWPAASPI